MMKLQVHFYIVLGQEDNTRKENLDYKIVVTTKLKRL